MSVAKVIEVTSKSTTSFDAAIREGLAKVAETVKGIRSAWVQDQEVIVNNGQPSEWKVSLRVTFLVE